MSRVEDALLLRDLVQKIVNDKLGKDRPGSTYATVTGFNPALGTVTVIYDGDTIEVEIPAGSIYPSEIGQVVKIGGPSGSRVVEDVMGENLTTVKVRDAQATADGKNTVNYGETPPSGTDHKDGDIWFDEANSNMPNVWDGVEWKSIEDLRVSAIAEAQEELKQDLDAVVENGVGTKTFYKPTQPTVAESSEGDLWFDTSVGGNNELHTFVNGAWVSAADARISAIKDAQDELRTDLDDVIENGSGTKTFYRNTQPTVAESKEGDLWFNTAVGANKELHTFTGGAWVSAADGRIATIKAAQDELADDVTAAQAKADEAFQDAADADTKAAQAASAAATAAGIAEGKGKVLFQSTAPGAADRNTNTLWIDTTGNANTPKRWTTGTTWVAVTDKAATDAASAAATAKSTADAAKTAADNAQAAASAAQSTATEALTSANTKNAVTRSTANPPAIYVGRVDDIWWKMSSMSSGGRVIGQYRWSGSAWIVETIDNAVIATLDAAKITTGYLAAARIKANTLDADTVLVNGSLGSIILRDGAITTPKIAVGAITAESGVVASLDAGKITVGTLDAARIAANSITADKVLLGGDRNMLPNGEVRTGDLSGWPNTLKVSTDAPDGYPFSVTNENNLTMSADLSSHGLFPVSPGDVLVLDLWVKADKPDSRLFIEVRSSGAMVADPSYRWESIEGTGPASSYLYPVANYTVPTTWTHLVQRVKIRPDVKDVYLSRVYFNHANGTEREAIQSIAGMKLYKAVGSTLIEPGAITTEKFAVGAITAESGIIASLDAGKITVGTLDAARIAANSITADKVLLASSDNMVPDPGFATDLGVGWKAYNGALSNWSKSSLAGEVIGTVTTGYAEIVQSDRMPALPGEKVFIEFDAYVESAWTAGYPKVTAFFYNAAGARITASEIARVSTTSTSWNSYSGTATAPAGTASVGVCLGIQTGSTAGRKVRFRNPRMRKQVGSTLIEPGAITTDKLAVGAITAESGVIGSLDASKITVGTLSGARLAADAIDGKQIVGATITTSLTFPRVQLDSSGLAVYKSSSVRSFFADAATGNLSIVGDFATATDGNERVLLSNGLWDSIAIVDENNTPVGTASGSGIRIGKGLAEGLDVYHVGRAYPSGYVDLGAFVGPRFASGNAGAILELAKTTNTGAGSLFNWGRLSARTDSGNMVAHMVVSGSVGGFAEVKAVNYVTIESVGTDVNIRAADDITIAATDDISITTLDNITIAADYIRTDARRFEVVSDDPAVGYSRMNVETGSLDMTYYKRSSPTGGWAGTEWVKVTGSSRVDIGAGGQSRLTIKADGTISANAIVSDSGWVTVSATSPARYYTNSETDKFKVRKINGVVHFTGTGGATSPTGNITLCTLPSQYRPSSGTSYSATMQGSGQNTWQLVISASGLVQMSRYGPGSSGSNTWLPFSATFMADTP